MMNTPETPSAKTGSPFLTTLPSLLKATVSESFAFGYPHFSYTFP